MALRDQPDLEPLDAELAEDGLLYVPSRPVREGDRGVALELQHHRGKLALLAYTAPELVETACGPHQPWVAIPADRLDAVIAQSGADGVLFNPVLSEGARHVGPVHDWAQRSVIGED